jgi:type IV pilus assembly protein PilF
MLVKMFPNSFEAKQYLLNDLEQIEADALAEQYKTYQQLTSKPKKRVVKLSPKKKEKIIEKPLKQDIVTQVKAIEKQNEINEVEPIKHASEQVNLVTESAESSAKQVQTSAKKNSPSVVAKSVTLPIHVVKKGDNLFSISKKYNIHMKAIERWNDINRNKPIKINDIIYLTNPQKLTSSD